MRQQERKGSGTDICMNGKDFAEAMAAPNLETFQAAPVEDASGGSMPAAPAFRSP